VENGYFGNPKVKIPLPPSLQRVERGLRTFGMRREADELVLAMNRAAEAAVPEAKRLLTDAVRKMSVQDAKGILSGGDTAATDYFRRATGRNSPSVFSRSSRTRPTASAWRNSTTRSPSRARRWA